jgi:hypothetical protein
MCEYTYGTWDGKSTWPVYTYVTTSQPCPECEKKEQTIKDLLAIIKNLTEKK